jgi:hypothetical protein
MGFMPGRRQSYKQNRDAARWSSKPRNIIETHFHLKILKRRDSAPVSSWILGEQACDLVGRT